MSVLVFRITALRSLCSRIALQRVTPCSGVATGYRSTHSAGLIVIGDEVLKGQVQDSNTYFLAKSLHQRGYKLKTITVMPDDVVALSNIIRVFAATHNIVLTTGGIGPTHDDVTYEALAKAFNDQLYHHPDIVTMCKEFFKTDDDNHPSLKLALIPLSAKLTYGFDEATGEKSLYPNVSVENVFVFPGVPHLCKRMFQLTCNQLFPFVGHFCTESVFLNVNESDATLILNKTVARFPDVVFGSYPTFFHSYYTVKIIIESLDQSRVKESASFLRAHLPGVVHYDEECFKHKKEKLEGLKNPFVLSTLKNIKEVINKNCPDNIYLFFDGGKNSTLLLHLLSIIYDDIKKSLNLIYIERNHKVNSFIKTSCSNYNTSLFKLTEKNFKKFFRPDPNITIVKGTRQSDPKFKKIDNYFSNLGVVILNPLFDWTHSEVWAVIRGLSLPYCNLYDRGHSSLDDPVNEKLRTAGPRKDLSYFKGSYLLENE